MSSGFLLAQALNQAFRKPYHRGNTDISVQYLIEGLLVGKYRVLLKQDFDTACWIPPVGKRDSHTIYYGDRMLERVVDFFCVRNDIDLPDVKTLVESAKVRLSAEKPATRTSTVAIASTVKLSRKSILDEKISWFKATQSDETWADLFDTLVMAVKSYGRHERQHARHTPQNLKQVNKDLKALGIPFIYFNLFEDARIEHISRFELHEKFGWLELEAIAPPNSPFNLFLRCIQLEGDPDREALDSEQPFDGDEERSVGLVADSVEGYYRRACSCSTAEQLYTVIAEFLREFKEDMPASEEEESEKGMGGAGFGGADEFAAGGGGSGDDACDSGVGERAGDLSTAAAAAEMGDAFFDEFESDTELVGGTDSAGVEAEAKAKATLRGDGSAKAPTGKGKSAQGIPESIAPEASGGSAKPNDFLARYPGAIDEVFKQRVVTLTDMLMRMFKTHNLPVYLESEGRRMSGRHLARGEVKFIHKKVFGGKGKRKYSIVYDCSGSMGGEADREGKLLLLALNNLAKRGYLEGHLVLSGYVKSRPSWLQYKWPVKDEVILSIATNHNAEGLQISLQDNLKKIKGMDDVFVYTDACITDAPIDREVFARNGIWPVGLYVGPESDATEMARHFPQNIIRPTIEAVVEAMLTRNRRTVR